MPELGALVPDAVLVLDGEGGQGVADGQGDRVAGRGVGGDWGEQQGGERGQRGGAVRMAVERNGSSPSEITGRAWSP
ncbi:hypothetical protein [Streptomyces canus]|uniref:hypothetical protein n=1 Tax=Streptomyces canus TaxID=58343 RepID=UPI002780244D|nr:hypothetical protein [Streptomyces canus]MDQ1073635.1 hypothetical protein [Streptomyces canus]